MQDLTLRQAADMLRAVRPDTYWDICVKLQHHPPARPQADSDFPHARGESLRCVVEIYEAYIGPCFGSDLRSVLREVVRRLRASNVDAQALDDFERRVGEALA